MYEDLKEQALNEISPNREKTKEEEIKQLIKDRLGMLEQIKINKEKLEREKIRLNLEINNLVEFGDIEKKDEVIK